MRQLSEELKRMGHQTSHRMVAELLHGLDYSLQGNRKTIEGSSHPDRNAQFEHINRKVKEHLGTEDPVISVDTKKKELVGNFKNGGREWRPKGEPEQVRIHDSVVRELGRAVPYGVYDLGQNAGWVSVGIDHFPPGQGHLHPDGGAQLAALALPRGMELHVLPDSPAQTDVVIP